MIKPVIKSIYQEEPKLDKILNQEISKNLSSLIAIIGGSPQDNTKDYDTFYKHILKEWNNELVSFRYPPNICRLEYLIENLGLAKVDRKDEMIRLIIDNKDIIEKKMNTLIPLEISKIVAKIHFVEKQYIYCEYESNKITYGQLLYLYTYSFQYVYRHKEIFRKNKSPFWGHCISDYVYCDIESEIGKDADGNICLIYEISCDT